MLRRSRRVVGNSCFFLLLFSLVANFTWAQSETATVSGQVVDQSGLSVTGAQVKLVDIDRDTTAAATTNNSGLYTFPSVRPGRYRIAVTAAGFKVVNVTGVTVNVQDHLEQNFKLVVGSISESITVEGGVPLVDTESATVSTVVDRNFAENLPMNGRSFQTLIQLTPGVVLTPTTFTDGGQFSVNGQRATSNYWTVDGVSANVGISAASNPGNGMAGALGSFSVLGGTNSLVSVDALQEFRIQTSTYAPEFGRTPGGQISIVTRSGANQFHGSAFDYFRNDILDASNWFNGFTNSPALPKAKERQNDFGGTFSGPILRDKTFFFFSYEGLRLRLPQTSLTTVPDASSVSGGLNVRGEAVSSMQPFLNAFPLPNGPEVFAPDQNGVLQPTGAAQFNASYSNPATLDAYSLRVDQKVRERLTLFARYNYSPSEIIQRGNGLSLSAVSPTRITTQTATAGVTVVTSPTITSDLRFNYSRTSGSSYAYLDSFGGAVPITQLPFPSPFTAQNGLFSLNFEFLPSGAGLLSGQSGRNLLQQINFVGNLSVQRGTHSLKFGVDFRRLSPLYDPFLYSQSSLFSSASSAETGSLFLTTVSAAQRATLLFHNLGIFTQDTWRIAPRLTLTYGLRWDVDFAPAAANGPNLPAVTGYNLDDLSTLAIAPIGRAPFNTKYGNLAPRFGIAYQLSQNKDWGAVFRGGLGVFYDLATSEAGNFLIQGYPFVANKLALFVNFPLDAATAEPPPITPSNLTTPGSALAAFDPNLKLPYTLEWNAALEQGLGREQTISASYVGATGRRLIQSAYVLSPNPSFYAADLVGNTAESNYNAMQIQFQKRLSHGLQVLASYTWSHSIDDGSAGSYANGSNTLVPTINANVNRGPSDFDIRNAFSIGLTYNVTSPRINRLADTLLRGWSVQNVIQAHTAPPVNVYYSQIGSLLSSQTSVRPDLVSGVSLYLYGQQYPGGKALNSAAFTSPPTDPNTGAPLRMGDLGRNTLRGFGVAQWDFSVHRDFPVHDSLALQFRAEMFNLLNHPNFGPQVVDLFSPQFLNPQFGRSIQTLGQSLNGSQAGAGAFNPLYQVGGPRSIQLSVKLSF
jgi:Carboxypeptidase regulatory-like domain/TonB dependent receptor